MQHFLHVPYAMDQNPKADAWWQLCKAKGSLQSVLLRALSVSHSPTLLRVYASDCDCLAHTPPSKCVAVPPQSS